MKNEEKNESLKGFEAHGIEFAGEAGNQAIGDCPFPDCGREGKFFVNQETRLWDCKVCGESGNYEDFLMKMAKAYQRWVKPKDIQQLAKDRKLPAECFEGLGIGFNGKRYFLPVYTPSLRLADLKSYKIGGRLMISKGQKAALYGAINLLQKGGGDSLIYLCEGEWDTIAMRWLLKKIGKPGLAIGVPGANTFKEDWARFFSGKDVRILYDNDQAGEDGEIKVASRISRVCKSLKFLRWSDGLPTGYDIRDLVSDVAFKRGKPRRCFKMIHSMLSDSPRSGKKFTPSGDANPIEKPAVKLKPITTGDLLLEYQKWLHLPNLDALKVMYGAAIANKLSGDPVWLFLVAPPGGSKSELLMSMSESEYAHALTSLTPHTLISGAFYQDGKDPSLLPQLNGRILIIKDFTTILTMHYSVRDEIFGVLRDVYDGSTEKVFGNGVKRQYNVHFGILAGVTPMIETFNIMHASLGERFLKFRITGNWDQESEEHKIRRALNNIGKEDSMRGELKLAASRYLQHIKIPDPLPDISGVMDWIVGLAKFSARLRGVVDRDKFSQMVMYKPSSEVGTRLAKQLTKLGTGIAIFLGKDKIDSEVYRLMRRCALDTVPDRSEDIIRAMWEINGPGDGYCPTLAIIHKTRLPSTTVFRLLQDLNLLKIVDKNSDSQKSLWRLSKYIQGLIIQGRIYDRELEVDGSGKVKIKIGGNK